VVARQEAYLSLEPHFQPNKHLFKEIDTSSDISPLSIET
jgi:hypothetical protein